MLWKKYRSKRHDCRMVQCHDITFGIRSFCNASVVVPWRHRGVVVMTISGATSDDKVGFMTLLDCHCISMQIIGTQKQTNYRWTWYWLSDINVGLSICWRDDLLKWWCFWAVIAIKQCVHGPTHENVLIFILISFMINHINTHTTNMYEHGNAELWCFFDLRLNKRLSRQSWNWWFETPSRTLWRHCNEIRRISKGSVISSM